MNGRTHSCFLDRPSERYRNSFLAGAAEFLREGRLDSTYAALLGYDLRKLERRFSSFVWDLRKLGEKRPDPPGEICRGLLPASVEEPHRVAGIVGRERNEPDERHGKHGDAHELAYSTRQPRPRHRQISMIAGRTNGRRPVRLRNSRWSSTRVFSLMSP